MYLFNSFRCFLFSSGLPAIPSQFHRILQHKSYSRSQLDVLRHIVYAAEILVHIRFRLDVVDLLTNSGEQLAQALDVLFKRILFLAKQDLYALVHDLFGQQLLFKQLSNKSDIAEHAQPLLSLCSIPVFFAKALCVRLLLSRLELFLALVEKNTLEVLLLICGGLKEGGQALRHPDAQVGIHAAKRLLTDGLFKDEVYEEM
mmetsp:Transcript_40568/g.67811  ORF Transcript_40568/g.67811 Transcript_40568/m.67811 type:complete len:201 (-) Transcript_40568:1012-1614(-)